MTTAVFTRLLACALLFATAASNADAPPALEQYRGKVVVVDFWASWCGPCRQSFPWLNSIAQKYRDKGLVVLGINVDRERSDADRFLKEVPANFPVVYDPAGSLATKYQVAGMPSTFILDPEGQVIATHVGFKNSGRADREAELERALAASRPQQRVSEMQK
jgi:thiol-disulfide isomerase/thioredoxin